VTTDRHPLIGAQRGISLQQSRYSLLHAVGIQRSWSSGSDLQVADSEEDFGHCESYFQLCSLVFTKGSYQGITSRKRQGTLSLQSWLRGGAVPLFLELFVTSFFISRLDLNGLRSRLHSCAAR
jgi:hypothetical protein